MHASKLVTTLLIVLWGAQLFLGQPHSATAATSLVPVSGSLQAAINAARPGDTLVLEPKTYNEQIRIEGSGEAQRPITLKGAGVGASTIQGSVRIEGAFIVLEDLTVDVNGGDDDAVSLAAPAHDIALRRVRLHNGTGYGVRVGNDVAAVVIEQCVIDNFNAGSKDAHGIGIMTAREVTVSKCDIFNTSGDAIQVNTPDYPGYGRAASAIRIEDNSLHDTRENALDIKSTDGLVAQNNLMWGFRAVDSSDGMAVQVQYAARNITLSGNQIWSAVEGIEVSRGVKNGTAYPQAPSGVLIAGNLIRDLVADPNGDSGSGSGIVVRSSSDVRVYNNTVLAAPGKGLYVSTSRSGDYPAGVDIRNNVFEGHADDLALAFAPEQAQGLVIDYNHYVSGRVSGGSLDAWRAEGYETHASSGSPQLDATWRPVAGSPLIDNGTPLGLVYKDAAPDRGWGELGGASIRLVGQYRVLLPLLRGRSGE